MRAKYKRNAYYLDDGILLCGYKDKRGFHPKWGLNCGFDTQRFKKKDIGVNVFYSFKEAREKLGNIPVAGANIRLAIDDGLFMTKICCQIGDFTCWYAVEKTVEKHGVAEIINEFLAKKSIKLCGPTITYCLSSESNPVFSWRPVLRQLDV